MTENPPVADRVKRYGEFVISLSEKDTRTRPRAA